MTTDTQTVTSEVLNTTFASSGPPAGFLGRPGTAQRFSRLAVRVVPAGYREVVLSDHPIGYWRLGEAASSSVAKDETSYGRDLQYQNFSAADFGQPGAVAGNAAIAFRPVSPRPQLTRGNSSDFAFAEGQSFSLELWIKARAGNASSLSGLLTKGYDAVQQVVPHYLLRYDQAESRGYRHPASRLWYGLAALHPRQLARSSARRPAR